MSLLLLFSGGSPPAVAPSSSATSTGATLAANLTGGKAPVTYAWTGTGLSFSNAAIANPTATVTAAGTYTASLTVTDANSVTASGSTSFTVAQVATTVTVTPSSVALANAATQQFAATVADQFGHAISAPTVTWSYAPGGSVNSTGLVTQAAGTLTATSGGHSGTASVLPGAVPTYAAASDVRLSIDRGDGTLGMLVVPSRSYVEQSQTFDNGTQGELILPPVGDVLESVVWGVGAGLSGNMPGTYHAPDVSVVLAPNTFGPASSLTGTATAGTIITIENINASTVNNPR